MLESKLKEVISVNIVRELRKRKGIQQKELALEIGVATATVSDWETQKKIAAARRKLENDFAACEKEINAREARNTEIDALFEDPDIAVNSVRLRELTEEKSANEAKLEELMQTWEDLYEKLNDAGSPVL